MNHSRPHSVALLVGFLTFLKNFVHVLHVYFLLNVFYIYALTTLSSAATYCLIYENVVIIIIIIVIVIIIMLLQVPTVKLR